LFEGNVQQVRFAPSTNQNVVTYTAVVGVDNKDLKLRPGMTANTRFITAERKSVLKVPLAAVRFRPPAGVTVIGDTNAPTAKAAPGAALIESGPFAGLPVMPWMNERRRPTDAERTAYAATLTPEQKQKYEKATAEFRARMAQRGGPGDPGSGGGGSGGGPGGGSSPRPRPESTELKTTTVYLKEKPDASAPSGQVVLRAVTVKLGIADASSVEVLEGLKENDEVVSGTIATVAAGPRNPLGNPFGGPGRR
jgi:HlyD family secretion protein